MKRLIAPLMTISIFAIAAFATNTQFQTRIITSATLTINVHDGQFLTINNFTQQNTGTPTQRGVVVVSVNAPTPTPAPTPIPTPSQTVSTVAGPPVVIGSGNKLTDTTILSGAVNPTGMITFTLRDPTNVLVDTETVTVNGDGNYVTPTGFSPATTGTYKWSALYSGDINNSPATDNGQNETETVFATPTPTPTPSPTPTQIKTIVLAAAINGSSPAEFIKPVVIAGPAVLTVEPVSGAILSITYRKEDQPIQPTPTPTATVTTATSATATTTTTSSAASTLSGSAMIFEALPSNDGTTDLPTPTPTPASPQPVASPTPLPTPTPTATPSVTPTPTPTP